MGWYLGHFPEAKRVRNELVHIHSLADVERIIQDALDHPEHFSEEEPELTEIQREEEVRDPELDLSCALD